MIAWDTSPWIRAGVILVFAGSLGVFAAESPETVLGLGLGAFWVCLIGMTVYQLELRRSGRWWARVIAAGLFARLATGPLHWVVGRLFYKGQVDLFEYVKAARSSAEAFLRGELIHHSHVPEDINYDFAGYVQLKDYINIIKEIRFVEHLNGILCLLVGPSAIGLMALVAAIGFLGSYLFWRAYRLQFTNERENRFFALMIFFLPSLVFWTSSLGKDSWMLLFLGWGTYSFSNIIRNKMRPRYLLGLTMSILFISLIRYLIGVGISVALVVAFFRIRWNRQSAALEPVRIVLYCVMGACFLVLGIGTLAGSNFAFRELGNLANPMQMVNRILELAVVVHRGFASSGESGLSTSLAEPTLAALVSYLPGAVFTFLFRPIVFEAHHALAFAAALEGTFFLFLIVLKRRNLGTAFCSGFRDPFVMFCLLALLFLTAMLSVERNLGAIVRHRSMVIPFLLVLLSFPPRSKRKGILSPVPGPGFPKGESG